MTAALIAHTERDLACAEPLVTYPTTGGGFWPVWNRFLAVRGVPVFEIGNICGTCQFWFRRLQAEARPVDLDAIQEALTAGLASAEGAAVDAFASLLQTGHYRIALFSLVPERVEPGSASDYFAVEQPAAWTDLPAGPPIDPEIAYYRVAGRSGVSVDKGDDLIFEFVAPLQTVAQLEPARIAFFEHQLEQGAQPTAVAVGMLDIKHCSDSAIGHWCLTHFLLDGHHKMEAAARAGLPITLLSFIGPAGISSPDDAGFLLDHYGYERRSMAELRSAREALIRRTRS